VKAVTDYAHLPSVTTIYYL